MANTAVYTNVGGENQLTLQARRIYQPALIEIMLPQLILWEDFEKETIPLHTGGFGDNEIQWRRWAPFSETNITTADAELGTVGMLDLDQDEITTKLQIYKKGTKLSDLAVSAGIDDAFAAAVMRLGQYAGRQTHKLMVAALEAGVGGTSTWLGGSNLTYGGSATSTGTLAASDKLTVPLLIKIRREFERRNVEPFPDGTFHMCVHPDQIYDLRLDSRWETMVLQNGGTGAGGASYATGMVGTIMGFKIKQTTDLTQLNTGGVGGNVPYAKAFAYGPHALGAYDFQAMTLNAPNPKTSLGVRLFSELPGKSSKTDMTGDWGYVAYKVAQAYKVIDPDRIQGVYTSCSA
jgi:N4-gp56 family major capsid protein